MGQEIACTARFGKQVSRGRALLEADLLIFRGAFRLSIPFAQMKSVRARDGRLTIRFPGGAATLDLGPSADVWAQKIVHPKSLLDKLGIRPGQRIAALGIHDAGFLAQLQARQGVRVLHRVAPGLDVVFLQADGLSALGRLRGLQRAIKPDGSIWAVAPKGVTQITEAQVLAAGKQAGLVDVKVVRFSQTHTAHKFVIPLARRKL